MEPLAQINPLRNEQVLDEPCPILLLAPPISMGDPDFGENMHDSPRTSDAFTELDVLMVEEEIRIESARRSPDFDWNAQAGAT